MIGRRTAALCLAAALAGCGGAGEMTLTEYVDAVNEAVEVASDRGEAIVAAGAEVEDFTPQVLQAGLEQGSAIRIDLQAAADEIEPPGQVAALHALMWDWHAAFIPIERAPAVRAGATPDTDEGWAELSVSPEMEAYREAIADGKQVCDEFQSRLDATSAGDAFAETPWIPGEMREVVEAVLGCSWFPEDPQQIYRYP